MEDFIMKLKKILALSACAAMTFVSVANAAYVMDDGAYVADEVTKAQVENYTPKAVIDIKSLTADEAKAAGLPLGRGGSALTDANSDFYKIDLTVSDLGDLMYAYLAGTDFGSEMQLRLFTAKVDLKGVVFKKIATASTFDGIAWTTSAANNEDDLLSMYWYAGSDEKSYPTRNPASTGEDLIGSYIENAALDTATFVFAVDEGYTATVTPELKITYAGQNDTDGQFSANATKGVFPNGDVVIGKTETCAEFAVNSVEKFDNGYVWTADLTKGTKDIASFKAKFEAGEAVAERAVKNPEVLNKFAGEGKVSFNIGLETKKELTKATFTINDGDDHVAEAPVK